jgi:uncharacterized membrane protein YgcG
MKKDLWIRLRDYHFDNLVPPLLADRVVAVFGGVDAPTQAFASKLSRKHGWTSRFARHAIHEYKKFVYLGVSSDLRVTPSKVIDVVWHEHLLFSRPYREFCDDVLGQAFDHNPELLPADDQTEVFNFQYEATLAAYEREFNMTPPADVWGATKFTRPDAARGRTVASSGDSSMVSTSDDTPLYLLIPGDASVSGDSGHSMFDFGGGGAFSGGGGGSSWGDHSATPADDASGTGSSDAGSSDGGSSGCSSSCSGGGCSS